MPEPESDPDETRRKFREALERKKAKSAGAGAGARDGGSKRSRARGPVENRREFRRKSG
jgi:hypothetical protein